MTPEILDTIVTLAVMVVMALISALVPAAHKYLKSGIAHNGAAELTIAAETVVRYVEQTMRPLVKDGKLTSDDAEMLKAAAMRGLAQYLDTRGRKFAAETMDVAIEASVQKLRQEQRAAPIFLPGVTVEVEPKTGVIHTDARAGDVPL